MQAVESGPFGKALVDNGTFKWWQEDELRDLCGSVGLGAFVRNRDNRFILFRATKPAAASGGERN